MSEAKLFGYLFHPGPGSDQTIEKQCALLDERGRELRYDGIQLSTEPPGTDLKAPLFERPVGKLLAGLPAGSRILIAAPFEAFPNHVDFANCLCAWIRRGVVFDYYQFPLMNERWASTAPIVGNKAKQAEFVAQIRKCIPNILDMPRRIRSERSRLIHRLLLKPYRRRNTLHAGPGYKWEPWPGYPHIERLAADPEELKLIGELTDRKLAGETFDQLYFSLLSKRIVKRDGKPWSRTRIQDAVKGERRRRARAAFAGRRVTQADKQP